MKVIQEKEKHLVKVDSPTLPRIYDLPKIEKLKLTITPTVNNISSLTYKLAKRLSLKYNSFRNLKVISSSIKNSQDLVDKIKYMNSKDRLISSDTALFPSIPVDKLMFF